MSKYHNFTSNYEYMPISKNLPKCLKSNYEHMLVSNELPKYLNITT